MKILEKYVLKSYIMGFLFCIVLLVVMGLLGDILGFIDDIFKHNIPLKNILAFYLNLAPFAFVNMVPFACMLSAVYVFNTLSKNHEITAVVASGLSLWRLLRPILVFTFMLCLVTLIINEKYVPRTMYKANQIRSEKLEQDIRKKRGLEDITLYGKGDQIIYAKSFNPHTKILNNVIIHRQDEHHNIREKISARLVKWREDGYWLGEDVIVFQVASNGDFKAEPQVYQRRKIPISESPEDFIRNQGDPRYMSYRQLKDYLNVLRTSSADTVRRLSVDLNYKLAFPFAALITVLIGVPFSIETGRASALIGMAKGIVVAVAYLPIAAISLALGKGGTLPPAISAWLAIAIFSLLGIYFVNKKS